MKVLSFSILMLSVAPLALANDSVSISRGLQQAKRVAAMENQSDLPSRAYWLSRRCIKNSKKKVSFQKASEPNQIPPSTQN